MVGTSNREQRMRIANITGRATLLLADGRGVDLAAASQGRLPADPQQAYERWGDVLGWAAGVDDAELGAVAVALAADAFDVPVPRPRQVFGIGANYKAHAAEAGIEPPEEPVIFTKFPSCLTGPYVVVELPTDHVDWEVEMVVVMGRRASHVNRGDAWEYVAGLTVGQDLSERVLQKRGPMPQISLAKSLTGFGPIGPTVVSIDEIRAAGADPDDLEVGCSINGVEMQHSRTSDLIFSVGELIEYISSYCTLFPGDMIFTGTPEGVGATRKPPRFLAPGDVLTTYVEVLGELRNTMTAARVRSLRGAW